MLRVVTGPFHPNLEAALVQEVRQLKAADPLIPLAIVVPSAALSTRLRELLVIEQGLPLLNVHFLTFHQLALRLFDSGLRQLHVPPAERDTSRLALVKDLFFEHLLGCIAGRELPGTEALRLANLPPGAWTALWATVRDLRDAAVDPSVALRAVDEGLFDPEEAPKLRALFTLHAAMLEAGRALGVGSVDDLADTITAWVPASGFLAQFQRICYYGFYDLTQVQLSLFEAVVRSAPVTLYFPLCDGPEFDFARRFYERSIQPLAAASEPGSQADGSSARPSVRIMDTAGGEDELILTCKEILTLVETNGYRFEEIGVVARTLEPYAADLRRTFDRHRIPFTSTAAAPVNREPAAKAVIQLALLPLTGFYRTVMLDLLSSPLYRLDLDTAGDVQPRPDLWRLAVQSLGITRGEEEWNRLSSVGQVEAWSGEDSEEEPVGHVVIPPAQLRALWQVVARLIGDCRALPSRGTAAELTDAFVTLVSRHLAIPRFGPDMSGEESYGRLAATGAAIQEVLSQLRAIDRIEGTFTWDSWARLLVRAMEQASVPLEPDAHAGVRVMDAMAARGLPFKAVFLLGLNEKVFPRFIREDAFLRDRHRLILEATLGYKIGGKLAGYDEERLLFALLTRAARSRLYLLYQRADQEGRPLATSPYLAEHQRGADAGPREPDLSLPRRLSDRMALPLFAPSLLSREELAFWLILQGHDPSTILESSGQDGRLFRNGWEALRRLEEQTHALGPCDGLIGPLDRYWDQLALRGLAPTPLEQYACCPFQYFAAQVLRLEPVRLHPSAELPAHVLGELCHAVLRLSCQRLVEAGWPGQDQDETFVQKLVSVAAGEVFTAYAAEHGTGYALVWQMARETVEALAAEALELDRQNYRQTGFKPIGFEVEAEGSLEGVGEFEALKIRGRWDRVDQREDPPGLRVVDYKYKQGRKIMGHDKDLLTAGVRGFRLQPSLYAVMTQTGQDRAQLPEQVEFVFLAPHWERRVERASFDAAVWKGAAGRQLKQTLQVLLEGMRAGRFFILPDDGYCDRCDFSVSCRRLHVPTWWRAHGAVPARQLRQLRKQKVTGE